MHHIEKEMREAFAEWSGTSNTRNWKVDDMLPLLAAGAAHIAGLDRECTELKKQLDAMKECQCP
jgi:hypothetical protein